MRGHYIYKNANELYLRLGEATVEEGEGRPPKATCPACRFRLVGLFCFREELNSDFETSLPGVRALVLFPTSVFTAKRGLGLFANVFGGFGT